MPEPVVSGAVTIPHVLSAVAERSPDAIAIEDGITGYVHSFGDLISTTESRSRSLATNIPVKSRVAIIMDGGSELPLWLLAIMWRHTVVPFSPHLSVDEVRRYLMLTKARWLIAETPNEPLAAMCRDEGITLTSSSAVLASLDAGASTPQPNEVDTAREHDIAAVLLTSGSTSTPKVVPLTHRNLMTGAEQVGRSLDLTSRDRCLVLWAQHHIGGIVDLLLAPLAAGEPSSMVEASHSKPSGLSCGPAIRHGFSSCRRLSMKRCVTANGDPNILSPTLFGSSDV